MTGNPWPPHTFTPELDACEKCGRELDDPLHLPSLDAGLRMLLDLLEAETKLPPKPTQYRRGWADAHARAAGLVRMHRFAPAYTEPDE